MICSILLPYKRSSLKHTEEQHCWKSTRLVIVLLPAVCGNSSDFSVIWLQGFVAYQLPSNSVTWGSVFRDIEENKERLGIVDYSISQTTLEQVCYSKWQCTQLLD